MFRRTGSDEVTLWFEGRAIKARAQDTIAGALLGNGIQVTRVTAGSDAARGPYCMMGACFDCRAIVDGRVGVQTCLTPVRDGMRIERQSGANPIA